MRILVYSNNAQTRQNVMLALGKRVHPDLPELSYVEVATGPVVIQQMDAGGIDLAILDGEATPEGGMGIAKQLKDEIDHGPPIVVLTGRRDDVWLASWSRAEAAVPQPDRPDPAQPDRARVAAHPRAVTAARARTHQVRCRASLAEVTRAAVRLCVKGLETLIINRNARIAAVSCTLTALPPDRLWLRSHLDC